MMTKEEAVTLLHLIDYSRLEDIRVTQIKLLEHACTVLDGTVSYIERLKDESQ